jgi:Glycosyltransferase
MGGAQYQAKCLVERLARREEFKIFYLARKINHDYVANGYKLIQIAKPGGLRRFGSFLDAPQLIRLLKDIKPDIIYQRGLMAYTGIAHYFAKMHGCKMIFHIAHDWDVTPFRPKELSPGTAFNIVERWIAEYGLRNVDYIVAQTQQQCKLLIHNYGREATAIVKNMHPLPNEAIEKELPIRVVWVANFKPMKQPEVFVRLARDLQDLQAVEFIMIGRPGERDLYKSLIKEVAGIGNLRYCGGQAIEQVNAILARAHVFVNTSIAEGFPNSFIQAWMRKVPVVSLSVNPDGIFSDGRIGFYSGTYERLREDVRRLIYEEGLRTQMGEFAQAYAFEYHSTRNAETLIAMMK